MQERGANFRVVYTPLHGAGLVPVTEILKRAGLKKLRVVEEQAQPDGDFPTVAAPNPEDPNAFTLALQLAKNRCTTSSCNGPGFRQAWRHLPLKGRKISSPYREPDRLPSDLLYFDHAARTRRAAR